MKLPLIVVRTDTPTAQRPAEFELIGARRRGKGPLAPPPLTRLKVDVTEASPNERHEIESQKGVLAAAPPMPIALIKKVKEAAGGGPPAAAGWGLKAINAIGCPFTGKGVTVAVLDTGIDLDHPAFAGIKGKITCKNFTQGSPDDDVDGHGTHCAGTIFGQDVKGTRIGVARDIERALIGKVIGEQGGSTGDIVQAIQWAQSNGAHVISMSLGMDFAGYQKYLVKEHHLPEEQATSLALAGYRDNVRLFDRISAAFCSKAATFNSGAVFAASGNESKRPDYSITVAPPAAAEFFQSIAAVGPAARKGAWPLADFCNDGAMFAAPGVDIWSAEAGKQGLVAMSGTSMATPHAAGIAALWAEKALKAKSFSGANLTDSMISACVQLSKVSPGDVRYGLVQAPQ